MRPQRAWVNPFRDEADEWARAAIKRLGLRVQWQLCDWCEEIFAPTDKHSGYCSEACRDHDRNRYRENFVEYVCHCCGRTYLDRGKAAL